MENIIRFRRPVRIRCLRSYSRVADKSYHCYDGCDEGILPGQQYRADVMVQGKQLWTERYHTPCCPPDPLKEEREENERLQSETRKVA